MPASPPAPAVSVIAPVFNNATTLAALCDRIHAAFAPDPVEILLVDDGSTDGSRALIATLPARGILRATNGGQNTAILDGLREASGEVCCVLDADLEDPPEALPALVAALDPRRAAVVFSSRDEARRVDSRLFRGLLRRLFHTLPAHACLCFAIDRASRERLVAAARDGDYLPAVIGMLGLPTREVAIARGARPSGVSAYSGLGRYRYAARVVASAVRLRWRRARSGA